MKIIKHCLLVLIVVTTYGCGTSAYIAESVEPEGASCAVNVFRDEFRLIWSMNIKADGRTYAKLSNNTYTSFYLKEGHQIVKADWNLLAGGVDLEVPFQCRDSETVNIAFQGYMGGLRRTIEGRILTEEAAKERLATYEKASNQ